MHNSFISTALISIISSVTSIGTQAATLNNGDVLTIKTGQAVYDIYGEFADISNGSYYGVDTNNNGNITGVEKTGLSQGTIGIIIGNTSTPGAYHPGYPTPSDSNEVTAPDVFLGQTGSWYFDIAPTGSTETGLDTRGWDWAWNNSYSTGLGGLAWQPGNCASLGCTGYTFLDGVGRFQWDGIYGHTYTLDITSTIPAGDSSGLAGNRFFTHLEGTVTAVPEPSPAWLFSSALLVLFGISKYRKV